MTRITAAERVFLSRAEAVTEKKRTRAAPKFRPKLFFSCIYVENCAKLLQIITTEPQFRRNLPVNREKKRVAAK